MWSFFTAGLTRRVCGREVVPGAAVCQGSVPRVPGVHHRRGLPHANALSRRHYSQVRNMGHGRTGKNTPTKLGNLKQITFFLPWPTLYPFVCQSTFLWNCRKRDDKVVQCLLKESSKPWQHCAFNSWIHNGGLLLPEIYSLETPSPPFVSYHVCNWAR